MANLSIKNDGSIVGVWAQASSRSSASIQANRTSASLMLYPKEDARQFKNPFAISVAYSQDQDAFWGTIQIPSIEAPGEVRVVTFDEFIRVFDAAKKIGDLTKKLDELEARLARLCPVI